MILLHCALYTSSKKVPSPTFCSPPPKKPKESRMREEWLNINFRLPSGVNIFLKQRLFHLSKTKTQNPKPQWTKDYFACNMHPRISVLPKVGTLLKSCFGLKAAFGFCELFYYIEQFCKAALK